MLGYEPSTVGSEVEITDYARCAHELGLTPKEFMARHNPMFRSGYEMLRPYATRIPCFASGDYQIICINNSSAPYDPQGGRWQGTLHTAKILRLSEDLPMVVEIVDSLEKVEAFLPELDGMITDGLVTLEKVRVLHYRSSV